MKLFNLFVLQTILRFYLKYKLTLKLQFQVKNINDEVSELTLSMKELSKLWYAQNVFVFVFIN